MTNKNKINIVFITDAGYIKPTIIAITSLLKNKNDNTNLSINVLTCNISDEDKRKISSINSTEKINIIDATYYVNKFPKVNISRHVTTTAILKFYLPIIFCDLDKILYLDSDILVQKDLMDLYNTDISYNYAGAIKDILCIKNHAHMVKYNIINKLYFNTGVLLLNLQLLREDNIVNKLISFRTQEPNYFMDQDTFNAVIGHNVKYISYKYNFLNYYFECMSIKQLSDFYNEQFCETQLATYKCCVILHLGGSHKPWAYDMGYLSKLYKKYWEISVLRDEKLKLIAIEHKDKKIQTIFSIKNDLHGLHKVITILGIKFKIKRKNNTNKIYILNNGIRKEVRKIKGLQVVFKGCNAILEVETQPIIKFKNSKIFLGSNSKVLIKKSSFFIKNSNIYSTATSSKVYIGTDFSAEGMYIGNRHEQNLSVQIGDNCMFSSDVYIRPTDGHVIYDIETLQTLNTPDLNSVCIGNHVWVCNGVKILKNTNIPDNCIVANSSVVNKKFYEENSIIAGIPASIVKKHVNWDRKNINCFEGDN